MINLIMSYLKHESTIQQSLASTFVFEVLYLIFTHYSYIETFGTLGSGVNLVIQVS